MTTVTAQATEPQKTAPVTPVATVPEVPKTDELAPKFAELAKKEKQLRAQAQALKAKEDALKAQETDYSTKYIPKDRLTKETLAVLQEQGISYDQLTNMILNQPPQPDQNMVEMKREIAALKDQLTQYQTKTEETQTQAYTNAVNQIRNEVKLLVDSDPAFETIKAKDMSEAVVELIKEIHKTEGRVMSSAEAAKEVEEHLIEEGVTLAGLKKIQERLKAQEATLEAAKPQAPTSQTQLRTLTNDVTSSTKPMSDKDRKARAIAAFKGQLK